MPDPVNSPDDAVMAQGKYERGDPALPEDNFEPRESDADMVATATRNQEEAYFLRRASESYRDSTSYLDNSIRKVWESSLHNFRSEHPAHSKYHKPQYKGRSQTFRPKTRAMVKGHTAAFAAAAFSNQDLLSLTPANQNDPIAAAGAKLVQQLVQYRMEHTLKWVLTALGAWQDTKVYGICISRQEWEYEQWEDVEYEFEYDENGDFVFDVETGLPLAEEIKTRRTVKDRPAVTLVAPDNFRFNVNADWRDPAGTSDFLIEKIPMIAADVMAQMEKTDPKTGDPVWRPYELSRILAAGTYANTGTEESTRLARAGKNRTDPNSAHVDNESSEVWIHLNTIQDKGKDYVFWTIGHSLLLTTPTPIENVFPWGRPYRIGYSDVDAHRAYPSSDVEQSAPLQEAINEITNQRRDNVALALNKRYFIKRQKQGAVDMAALMRSVPGGGVMVDDIDDVRVVETNDVTSSAYEEQDRYSIEFDELVGNFSQGSVMPNRSLNETVGGMNLMKSGANAIQELSIRVFLETWMAPVVRDLARLEQMYETDEIILALAGDKAGVMEELRTREGFDAMLEKELLVKVNVGMGHTNPTQKVEKLSLALNTLSQFPTMAARFNEDELAKEVFSFVGYSDGDRFLVPMEELPEPQEDPTVALEREKIASRERVEMAELELKRELGYAELALKENLKLSELEVKLGMDTRKNKTVRDMAAARENNKAAEIELKRRTGEGV